MEMLFENLESLKYPKLSGNLSLNPTRGAYSDPLNLPAARANLLTHIGLWPMAIKLNPSCKMEVSKSA